MTAKELLHIIDNGNELGEIEFQSLAQLHREFPYFVLPTILAAKYQINNTPNSEQVFLPLAATQSPDRKRLKFLITNPISFLPFLPDQQLPEVQTDILPGESDTNHRTPDTLPKEITLSQEKDKGNTDRVPEKKVKSEDQNNGTPPAKSPDKSPRRDVLKDLEENLTRLKSTGQETLAESPAQKIQSHPENNSKTSPELSPEALIAAIKQRKEKDILDEKKQIQDELIDDFNKKTVKFNIPVDSGDLDESLDLSIESTRLKENLISESFAKILVKQKKIKEAREIYQKLQLKFPDKKAYFADCLEKLENN